MRPTLHTDRLILGPLADSDAADLTAMNGDPEVMAFIGPPMTREQVLAELPRWVAGEGDFGLWAGRTPDRFVGVWFLSRDPDDDHGGKIGWRLPRAAWGHGFAVEGASALVEHAFGSLHLDRLRAETMAVNLRSRRVMERLGMIQVHSYVGRWDDPIPGWEHGEVVYELRRRP